MEELTDFLTNKWFTSLNQALLWQKSKYQMFAPPVLWILCVHQSSLKTLKAITWQVLCLLKLWENSAHLGATFLYWQNLCAFNYISGFSWDAANSGGPCRQNKKGANAESSLNHFHSFELSDNKGFLGNNHLYIIFICRKNILECSPRYVFRTHLRFSPARKFKQIGLEVKTGKTRMLHKLQRRQSEF